MSELAHDSFIQEEINVQVEQTENKSNLGKQNPYMESPKALPTRKLVPPQEELSGLEDLTVLHRLTT